LSNAKTSNKWLSMLTSSVVVQWAVSLWIICFSFNLKSRLPTKPRLRRTWMQVPQTLFGSSKSLDANLTEDSLEKGRKVLCKNERPAETGSNVVVANFRLTTTFKLSRRRGLNVVGVAIFSPPTFEILQVFQRNNCCIVRGISTLNGGSCFSESKFVF